MNMDRKEKIKVAIIIGLIAIAVIVGMAIYIPWQTKNMTRDSARDATEQSPENLQLLYTQWQGLMEDYRTGDQDAIYEADKLAVQISDLSGDDSILIPTDGGHFIIDGSKI